MLGVPTMGTRQDTDVLFLVWERTGGEIALGRPRGMGQDPERKGVQ